MPAGVKAQRSHQKWKRKTLGGDGRRGRGARQYRARHGDDPRHDHIRQAAQAFDIGGASGLEHGARMIDDRPIGPPQEPAGRFQAFPAQIGIADTVEDQIVGRQQRFRIRIFRRQHRGPEGADHRGGSTSGCCRPPPRSTARRKSADRRLGKAASSGNDMRTLCRGVGARRGGRRAQRGGCPCRDGHGVVGIDPQRRFEMKRAVSCSPLSNSKFARLTWPFGLSG